MQLYLHLGDVAFIRSMRTSPLDWRVELQECLPDGGSLQLLWKIHLAQSKLFKLPHQRLWRDVLADTARKGGTSSCQLEDLPPTAKPLRRGPGTS